MNESCSFGSGKACGEEGRGGTMGKGCLRGLRKETANVI